MALNERHNIVRASDAYKITQVGLDPEGIEYIMEYMTARGGVRNRAQFFGLQYYLKEYLEGKKSDPLFLHIPGLGCQTAIPHNFCPKHKRQAG